MHTLQNVINLLKKVSPSVRDYVLSLILTSCTSEQQPSAVRPEEALKAVSKGLVERLFPFRKN